MARAAIVLLLLPALAVLGEAQTKKRSTRRPAAPSLKTEPADLKCPATLGTGVATKRSFCDVLTGRDPKDGILVTLPAFAGTLTLSFDLHNRHTYSEDQVQAGRGYARYLATIGVLTLDNTLIARGAVQSEVRTAKDLFDRVTGGAGPSGLKAVAPLGVETVFVAIPAGVTEVSILGEQLTVDRIDGRDLFRSPGRPIAVLSRASVEYRPAPARRRR